MINFNFHKGGKVEIWKLNNDKTDWVKSDFQPLSVGNSGQPLLGLVLNELRARSEEEFYIVFSDQENEVLETIAGDFLPPSGILSCRFLSAVLSPLNQMWRTPPVATYIPENPDENPMVKGVKNRLAIRCCNSK